MNLGILLTPWRLFCPTKASKSFSSGGSSNLQRPCSSQTLESFGIVIPTTDHFEAYSFLNDQLLRCIMTGKSESAEAEAIRDQMDIHWKHLSLTQQEAMRLRNEKAIGS